jgi:hypothetical protein
LKTIKINLSLPDMTLISTDNDKTKKCKKCFTMYLEKKGHRKTQNGILYYEIYESEEHFDIEPLYQNEKKLPCQ